MDLTRLKKEFEDRPLEFAAVATAAVIAMTKVVEAVSSTRSKNAYAKMIKNKNRRRK